MTNTTDQHTPSAQQSPLSPPPGQSAHPETKYRDMEDEIDLLELVQAVWRQKWIVVIVACLSVFGAISYLNKAKYIYTVTLKVVPVDGKSKMSSQLGGLANLAGISLPSSDAVSSFDLYKELLVTLETADTIAKRDDIMRTIFRPDWNLTDQAWRETKSALSDIKVWLKGILGVPIFPWRAPDGVRLKAYLEDAIIVSTSRDSPVTTISIHITDPALGKDLLLSLHEVADNSLREIAIEKATRHIDYLMQQLNKVTVSDYRQVLIENLSAQEKSRMLASSGLFFAAEPLGVPTAPRFPTNPKPALVLALSVVMGLFTGILIALLRVRLKTPARKTIK